MEGLGEPTVGAAYDFVRVYKMPSFHLFKDIEIESCDINQDPLPLSHLAILTQIVHEQEEYYNLFYSQRHWFAYIIARVITQTRSYPIPSQSSDLGDIDHHYHLVSRTYVPIAAHVARVEVITVMEQMFVDRCERFERELKSRIVLEEQVPKEDLKKFSETVMKAQSQRWEELRHNQAGNSQGDTEVSPNLESLLSSLSEIR
jgi:hypothetical protein